LSQKVSSASIVTGNPCPPLACRHARAWGLLDVGSQHLAEVPDADRARFAGRWNADGLPTDRAVKGVVMAREDEDASHRGELLCDA
jgi:hypothetical protein